jgi:ABC-type antimicrobial peptide transport system permease subunit
MARAFWPTHSAVGQRLGGGIVVGVVDNPKEFKLGEDAQPVYYVPTGANRDDLTLFLRTAINPGLLASAVSHEVHGIDPDLAIERMATMQSLIAGSNDSERQRTMLITIFAGVAVILVLIGLYGVISRSVTQRTRELGIRIAVGAPARSVLWLVLRESLTLTLAGSLIGSVAAVAATRLIRSFLFGITPTDVSTYAFIACGLIIASLAASYLPARRAVQIDPMECLRLE